MTAETLTKQQQFATELNQLMQQHPDLPVIPMVSTDVCSDDSYSNWAGSLGKPVLDKTYQDDERIYFKSTDFDSLAELEFDKLEIANGSPGTEKTMLQARKNVEAYDWQSVITLFIDLPA